MKRPMLPNCDECGKLLEKGAYVCVLGDCRGHYCKPEHHRAAEDCDGIEWFDYENDTQPTQLDALRSSLVAAGFLLDGEREPDSIGFAEEDCCAWLDLDYPDDPVTAPCALSELMRGVALRVRAQTTEAARNAKHRMMWKLHRAGFWPEGEQPPCETAAEVVVLPGEVW